MSFQFRYKPDGAVLREFMKDDSFVRCIRGHVASGKSVACAVEIFRRACQQEPDVQTGKRRTRWAVVRNTNPQLKTTTIKTWLEWVPEHVFGKFNWSPPYTHNISIGDVEMEVIFLALDTDVDVRKLLSLELTGGWANEAREIPKSIIDAMTMRVNRFPSLKDGVGATHPCVIADTNPPSEDHWWAIMSGDVPPPEHLSSDDLLTLATPPNWKFFDQPPAMIEERDDSGELTGYRMNPDRENQKWIPDKYFLDLLTGKTREWINVYVMNRYGHIFEGRPVYPDFKREIHVAKERLNPVPGLPIYCGIDFGLTPAAVFGQRYRGRWIVLREKVTENMGTVRFANELTRFMNEEFPGDHEYIFVGDPAGDARVQTDEQTSFSVLRAAGINARAASTNDPELRIAAVTGSLTRIVDGVPGYVISPCCKKLIAAKEGGYHYKLKDRPEKNSFSHVSDAEQYMMDGAGETRALVRNKHAGQKPVIAAHKFRPGGGKRVRYRPSAM